MFDERKFEIKPAMYSRWALMNINPFASRNQQYVFSQFHNKDVRAAEAGIFHNMNSTKNIYKVGEFLQKINNNDEEIEINLSTVLHHVRNSKQYWNRVASDLRAFNENRGPAHFFQTLNPAEYNWQDLKSFLVKNFSDIPNVQSMPFNELLSIEPGLV